MVYICPGLRIEVGGEGNWGREQSGKRRNTVGKQPHESS